MFHYDNPPIIVPLLFWGTLLASTLALGSDHRVRAVFRDHWKAIWLVLAVVLVWRLPLGGGFFHGLEYEDAYVYTVSGRQLAMGKQQSLGNESPYLTTVCAVGSLDACQIHETYSGHYIGYPYVIGLMIRIFGYSPSVGNWASLLAACFSAVAIFCICRLVATDGIAPIAGAVVFAVTPVFAVYGIGTYAEPLSNACVSLSLLLFFRYLEVTAVPGRRLAVIANWCALTFCLFFAVIVKRENIILGFGLLLGASLLRGKLSNSFSKYRQVLGLLVSAVAVTMFGLFELRLADTLVSETSEYGKFPFDLGGMLGLLPLFLESFALPRWYSVGFICAFCGAVVACRQRTVTIVLPVLFIAYILLYASHVRSFYQLHSNDIVPEDAIRYSMNCMSLWSILAGFGIAKAVEWVNCKRLKETSRRAGITIVGCAAMLFVVFSNIEARNLRREVLDAESRVRLKPALIATKLANQIGLARTFVVTLEPLLIQMYAASNVNVLALPQLDREILGTLKTEDKNVTFLYVDQRMYRNPADRQRYGRQLTYLEDWRREELYSDDEVVVSRLKSLRE